MDLSCVMTINLMCQNLKNFVKQTPQLLKLIIIIMENFDSLISKKSNLKHVLLV